MTKLKLNKAIETKILKFMFVCSLLEEYSKTKVKLPLKSAFVNGANHDSAESIVSQLSSVKTLTVLSIDFTKDAQFHALEKI